MTWDVPVKDDCPVCGHTMFKKAGRGFKKPFCIIPECSNSCRRRSGASQEEGRGRRRGAELLAAAAEETARSPPSGQPQRRRRTPLRPPRNDTAKKPAAAKTPQRSLRPRRRRPPKRRPRPHPAERPRPKTVASKAKEPTGTAPQGQAEAGAEEEACLLLRASPGGGLIGLQQFDLSGVREASRAFSRRLSRW